MLELTIIGNLGQDATIKEFKGQKFIAFSVGDNETYTDKDGVKHEKTTWVSCLKYTTDQSTLAAYLKAGVKVFVRGRASSNGFVTRDGNVSSGLNCKVEELHLLSAAKRTETPVAAPQSNPAVNTTTEQPKTQQTATIAPNTGYSAQQTAIQVPTNGEDDLPF